MFLNGSTNGSGNGRFTGILGPDGQPFRKDAPDSGFTVPHVINFASVVSGGLRSYLHGQYDEAMKHSREDAIAMRNDAFLMSLLQERKLATASLRWRIEVDDERDPLQKSVQDGLTRVIRRIPRFRKMCMYMLEAIWYGRYASQLKWGWGRLRVPSLKNPKQDEERKCLVVKTHQPINGDKIGHHWDGTPYILVNPAYASQIKNAEIAPTSAGGMGLYLRGSWRWRYCVHTHEAVDADYFDAMAADAIHGLGIRSVLFWLDWLRKEWLSNVADWCERTGLGIRLWYYQGNNPNSKTAVEKAARESNDRTNIFIPRYQTGANASEGVEFVDTSSTGADLLLRLQEHIEEIQERYVVGQSLSGGRGAGDSLGGEGKSKIARDTKTQIIAYDAGNLGETLTTDIVKPIQHWTYREPEAREVDARLVFAVDEPDQDKFLGSVKTFVEMGGKVRMSEVQAVMGLSQPQDGDEVISMATINKAKEAGMPQPQPGMPGLPGGAQPPAEGGTGEKPEDNAPGGEPQDPPAGTDNEQPDEPAPGADDVRPKQREDDLDAGLADIMKKRFARTGAALRKEIDAAAAEADPNPSEEQRKSGNYRCGHVTVHGLRVTIETAAGNRRKPQYPPLAYHYGYIKRTEGKDGDHIDVFLGPNPESEIVFVVDQTNADGVFDEHKCMIGWTNAADAKEAYLANYTPGWKVGPITPLTIDAFKNWIKTGDTSRPLAETST